MLGTLLGITAIAVAALLGLSFYFSSSSIHSLLTENHELNQAIRNLTQEEQIGFATVVSQETDALGQITTVLKFTQTAAGHPKEVVDEQTYTIPGNVVHFDALIVKFSDAYVREGKERALYLWRRIYGEQTAPDKGQMIEVPGSAPERYYAITKSLKVKDRQIFWPAIWSLANNPQRLSEYGITAVFGNAIYTKVEPDKVYLFKIGATGQIYPEVLDFTAGK
jgi:protein-disulfide isomerase